VAALYKDAGAETKSARDFAAVTAGRWPISTAGDDVPRWRRDGKELFFTTLDGKLMAAAAKQSNKPKQTQDDGQHALDYSRGKPTCLCVDVFWRRTGIKVHSWGIATKRQETLL
jgi:hypothetical protein